MSLSLEIAISIAWTAAALAAAYWMRFDSPIWSAFS
jgi:hypothetical protein